MVPMVTVLAGTTRHGCGPSYGWEGDAHGQHLSGVGGGAVKEPQAGTVRGRSQRFLCGGLEQAPHPREAPLGCLPSAHGPPARASLIPGSRGGRNVLTWAFEVHQPMYLKQVSGRSPAA